MSPHGYGAPTGGDHSGNNPAARPPTVYPVWVDGRANAHRRLALRNFERFEIVENFKSFPTNRVRASGTPWGSVFSHFCENSNFPKKQNSTNNYEISEADRDGQSSEEHLLQQVVISLGSAARLGQNGISASGSVVLSIC